MKLEIQLDRPDGVYLAGDTVSGVVTIHDPDGGRGKIQLVREWRAHGRGSGDHGSRAETTIAENWSAGTVEIPFSVPMPDGPFTYRGTHTNIDWYIRAETGGLLKTKAEIDLIYGAIPDMPSMDFGPSYTAPVPIVPGKAGAPPIPPALGIGCGVVLLGVIAGGAFLVDDQIPLIWLLFFMLLIAAGLATALFSLFRNTLAGKKLGEVNLSIEPLVAQPNQNIQVRFSTTVKADLELEKIEVKLVHNEFYATGSGTNRTTHIKPIYTVPVQVSERRHLRAGEQLEFALELPIPDGAATTFMANDNRVYWQVLVTLPIKGWADWQHIQDITVRP
jgi:hypothetical protein